VPESPADMTEDAPPYRDGANARYWPGPKNPRPDASPADTIRRAAALMRQRAQAATPGRREVVTVRDPGPLDFPVRIHASGTEQWSSVAECCAADAEHIAGMYPAVTRDLAVLLALVAAEIDGRSPNDDYDDWRIRVAAHQLALAYLGEPDPNGTDR
jgi:hypothetical protein